MSRISEPMLATPEDVYDRIKEGETLDSKVIFIHPQKTNNKAMSISLGRAWLNLVLPDDYPLVDEAIDKSKLNSLIVDLYKKYGVKKSAEYITKLQSEAFKLASISPNTFNIDTFIPPDEWIKEKKEFEKIADTLNPLEFKKEAEKITKKLIAYINENGFRVENIMDSGAKGNPVSDWGALMVAKGYVIDIEGNLLGPIKEGINDGYSKINYYNAAAEARRNFFMRSSSTAIPGYLTTKCVMANAGLSIDESSKNCGTRKTFEITVTPDLANLIRQRYYVDGTKIQRIDSPEQVIGKTIKLRSPLYCKSEHGICPTCYGDFWKTLGSKNIGILAGGAINVVGINALMKMRHQSTSISTKEVDFIDIIRKSGTDPKQLELYFKINKTTIEAKQPCSITIDQNEYDDITLIDCGDKYQIPGILTVQFGEPPNLEYVTLPIAITVDLIKPNDYSVDGHLITLNYEPGEIIMKREYYDDEYDERVVTRLFDAGAKYLTNPEILCMVIHDKLPGIDMVHIETIVSNMFRDSEDLTIPARLTNYKNVTVVGQKRLPFIISWLNALSFENINKAIKIGLLEGKDAQMDPIESIVAEQY